MPDPLVQPVPDPSRPKPKTDTKDDDCARDDFGRWCKPEKFMWTTVHAYTSDMAGHAALEVKGWVLWRIVGWWPQEEIPTEKFFLPVPGELRNDRKYMKEHGERKVRYNACPETMKILNASAKASSTGQFNLFNFKARNCTGWVCQVLRAAEVDPLHPLKPKLYTPPSTKLTPNPCETLRLKPIHLTPGGVNAELAITSRELRIFQKRYPHLLPPEILASF